MDVTGLTGKKIYVLPLDTWVMNEYVFCFVWQIVYGKITEDYC